jgi:iron-sulfur cluster repair protein YtfE (RIC family)
MILRKLAASFTTARRKQELTVVSVPEGETRPTETFREEHRHLLTHVEQIRIAANEVTELGIEEREAVVGSVLEFLRKTLLPHAEWEEQVLYTAVGELLGDEKATATMSRDHVAIERMIDALEEAERADVARLQELLYGLHALITVHFEKEEEIYLPLLDARPDVAERVMAQIRGDHGGR